MLMIVSVMNSLVRKITFPLLRGHSLKTGITLFVVFALVAGMWSLAWYAGSVLQRDMTAQVAAQQYSTASMMAAMTEREMAMRIRAVESVAAQIDQSLLDQPARLQERLAQLVLFQSLFNEGSFVTGLDGTAIASLPVSLNRVGINYADREYMRRVLQDGLTTVSKPVVGRAVGQPVFVISAPVRDPSGRVIGAVAGVVNLAVPNFLDVVQTGPYGKTGGFLLVDPRNRLIVMASERERVMEVLPPEGYSPILDKFIQGYEGTQVFVNPEGVEVVSSVKHISAVGWCVAVTLPTQEAFAPIQALKSRIFLAASVWTVLLVALIWWWLSRQLDPLQKTARMLADQAAGRSSFAHLEVTRDDEIGQVIQGFNGLLSELEQREERLKESEQRYRTAFRTTPDALAMTRLSDGALLDVNDGFVRQFGWERDDLLGRAMQDLGLWRRLSDWDQVVAQVQTQGHCDRQEFEFAHKDGFAMHAEVSATQVSLSGVSCMLSVVHDVTERKASRERLQHLAFFDGLTGLPNRSLFMDRLHQALMTSLRHKHCGALVHLDLSSFKTVNDIHGHESGDLLLKAVAQRLLEVVRDTDTVTRVGADEFVVMLEHLHVSAAEAAAQARAVSEKLLDALGQPFALRDFEYRSGASVGITLFGLESEPADEVMRRADLAVQQAKLSGRGSVVFYEPGMGKAVRERFALEGQLRQAVQAGAFELHLQAQVCHERVTGAEALMRWQDPERGWIPPSEFIPLAEECGLIHAMGQWVLDRAAQCLTQWAQSPALKDLTLSVNVSARQFHQDNFVQDVVAALERHGARADRLKLELTESLFVAELDSVIERMHALKAVGVGFSLDDFGTGFSSLAYLKRMPLDQLKIDQGFVRDLLTNANDAAIASMVITLGRTLGLEVVAEGVETDEQRAQLQEMGCHCYQGYWFARPMPMASFEAWLAAQPSA